MLYYATMFLFVGLIAGALNWVGVAVIETSEFLDFVFERGPLVW